MAQSKKGPAKRSANMPRPDGELRQSQMITTYGPGALVDLVDDAILIPGLEYWSYKGASGYELQEDRLALNLRNRGLKTLSMVAPFRAPPASDASMLSSRSSVGRPAPKVSGRPATRS